MNPRSRYQGLPVSEGVAAGRLYLGDTRVGAVVAAPDEVRAAFAAVVAGRLALAETLREGGRAEEADIVSIGALLAGDPSLVEPAVAAVRDGADAVTAVESTANAQAEVIAALPSPELASRADDIRQVASAVLAHLAGAEAPPPPAESFILIRREVDPADLIRLTEVGLAGAVSVSGGANSHASIIARGLGIPMLAGADPEVLAAPASRPAILDATAGHLTVDPSPAELAAAAARAAPALSVPAQACTGSPQTKDGQDVTLLCNVASAPETRLGLAVGGAGVGLLRTEIPFVSAPGWPSEADHRAVVDPVMALLAGKPAVVRLLDFAGDKIPAFLAGRQDGLTALIEHPRALRDQLRAVLRSGQGTRLGVMIPMVRTLGEVRQVREVLTATAAELGAGQPELGMMVEVPATAADAAVFAAEVDFFSIGTNDLTSMVLGIDRADPSMRPALAADPRVLTLVDTVVRAAAAAGVKVSVCGDAAADPAVLPLLIGLGVRTLSVGAARLPQVAEQIAATDSGHCAVLASHALQATTIDQVWAEVRAS
jgi:phosphoenolpyruvate-protein kinase (PTS system EI component)